MRVAESMIGALLAAVCASAPVQDQDRALAQVCGTWKVARAIPTKNVQASPIKGFIGQAITYSPSKMSVGTRTVVKSPHYVGSRKTDGRFFTEYFVSPAELGISRGDIVIVKVQTAAGDELYEVGDLLIVRDSRTLVTTWEGVFYELNRLSPCGK